MIILDTNVLSEIMQPGPDVAVVEWLNQQPTQSVWTTSVTVFEVRMGISLLAHGRHREHLDAAFARALAEVLEWRVLPFDRPAAENAGTLAAERRQRGFTVDMQDTQIAGIVVARRATIATRNVDHFQDLDRPMVNPWNGPHPQDPPRASS